MMEIWKAREKSFWKSFRKRFTSSTTESTVRFVWSRKGANTRQCLKQYCGPPIFLNSYVDFWYARNSLRRTSILPNPPKTHQLHHIRRVFVHRYAYLRSTMKGPADSIPSDEAIRAGRKALVAARKLP